MDTKKLVVGQDVYVVNDDGTFFRQGKVTEVMSEGVEVLTAPYIISVDDLSQDYDPIKYVYAVPLRFDKDGKGYNGHKQDTTAAFWGEDDRRDLGWDLCGYGP